MKKSLFDIRIPNFAAFLLLIVSIGLTVFLVRDRVDLTGHASQDIVPEDITISNITDTSFTVSFTTQSPSQGGVVLENTSQLNTIYSDTQETDSQKDFVTHYIIVNKLTPETDYSFSVISSDKKYQDAGKFFTVKTAPSISDPSPNSITAHGMILLSNGLPASQAVVYLSADNSQFLSALTANDGTFKIPLSKLRTTLLTAYQTLSPHDVITIKGQYQRQKSTAQAFYQNLESVPPITLSENYNFTNTIEPINLATQAALPVVSVKTSTNNSSVSITSPTAKATLIDAQPQIKGTAGPNQSVKITISPGNISTTVPTSTGGNWSFRPTTRLAQGAHTVSVTAKNSSGVSRTVTQTFTILPSGSQVADVATPSATIAITKSPTPTTPQATPTPIPSISVSPSITASATATFTPSPTFAAAPTATPTIPRTPTPILEKPGASSSLVLTAVSLFFIVTGAVLFFIIS